MEIPLRLAERVATSIELGESSFREFKSAWEGAPGAKRPRQAKLICREIAEGLVCFANADGGDFIVGVEDDGTVTGVPHSDADLETMLSAPATHVFPGQTLPIQHKGIVTIGDKKVVYFSVANRTSQIFQVADGRCMRRRDRECVPEDFRTIQFERQEARSREFERQFVDGATVNDLDQEELQIAANSFLKGISPERYLQQLQLAEFVPGGLRLRMAALLLFAKDVRRWHPRCQVRLLRVQGTELLPGEHYNVAADVPEEGNIFRLIETAWPRLRTFLVKGTTLSQEARFETALIFPEAACQEALINAMAHRDYSIQNAIEVYIFNNRIEVRSPGALLSTLTVKELVELGGAHESRNALIARVLREHRVMRELGEGMRRMFEAMELHEFERPEIRSNGTSFSVTLYNRSMFSPDQLEFLDKFQEFKLSRLQKRIVVAGMRGDPLSRDAILAAMNTSDRDTYDAEVTGLRKRGILEEVLSQAEARAKKRKIEMRGVPRFRVVVPDPNQRPARVPGGRRPAEIFPEGTGVYITGAPPDVQRKELESLFGRFGRVRKVLIKEGQHAVVWLESEAAVNEAVERLYGIRVRNHELRLRRFRSKDGAPSTAPGTSGR